MEQWYALHTKPNSEYQVVTVLHERGIETYLPEIKTPKTQQQPRKTKPFFPCYLFMKADFEQIGLSQIQWTPGLRRIVTFDENPVPVPTAMIDLVRRRLGELEVAGNWSAHDFQPGDPVRITDGPFRDMLAIFEGPNTPAQRVQVLLKILGASRVQVDVTDLEKAPPDIETPVSKQPRRTRGRGRQINYRANLN